jgi:hypothetical protein
MGPIERASLCLWTPAYEKVPPEDGDKIQSPKLRVFKQTKGWTMSKIVIVKL